MVTEGLPLKHVRQTPELGPDPVAGAWDLINLVGGMRRNGLHIYIYICMTLHYIWFIWIFYPIVYMNNLWIWLIYLPVMTNIALEITILND